MSKTIKFTASGSSSTLGNFQPGDIARNIPDELADHLVNEARCAQYLQTEVAPAAAAEFTTEKPAAKRPRKAATEEKDA